MTKQDSITDRIISDFLIEYAEDRHAGRELPLSHYISRRPDHETEIAGEFLTVNGRMQPPAEEPGALPGETDDPRTFVGPYRLVRELGRGGQATVFLAEDRRISRRVALKVFSTGVGRLDPAGLRRFRREAELLARLAHPSLCTVHEAEIDGDVPYIAMRYVEGESLAHRIASLREAGGGPPDRIGVREAVRVVAQCARALHVAHEAGLLHRDIKPGNVMLTESGTPVLLDFGLARDQEAAGPSLTRTGDLLGTPAYMAPESLSHEAVDQRSDVYALGVTLFEALTLRHPFDAPTRDALYREILAGKPAEVRRLNPKVDEELAVVVAVALERAPDRRYGSALALAEDLERWLQGEPVAARPPSLARRARNWIRVHPVLFTVASSILLFVIVGWAVTAHLLGLARGERNAKVAALEKLDGFLAPADTGQLLRRLTRAGEELVFNAETVDDPDIERWAGEAREALRRLPNHRAALEASRAKARPSPKELGGSLQFDSVLDAWSHQGLTWLVEELEDFERAFQRQYERARIARKLSLEAGMDAWREVGAELAAPPLASPYSPMALAPQPGLIPLGEDPESELFEFAFLQSGDAPERDAKGALVLTDRSAIVMVLVPGGRFEMGSVAATAEPNEGPVHELELSPFLVSKYELTQGQWRRLTANNPSNYRAGGRIGGVPITISNPVEWVNWEEGRAALWEFGLLLPTEAQWEYAARGGTRTRWWTGDEPRSVYDNGNLRDLNGNDYTETDERDFEPWLDDGHAVHAPVGSFQPNPFGLHDVLGNVLEWCRDAYGPYETEARAGDGLRHEEGAEYILRGGSFYHTAAQSSSSSRRHAGVFWGLNIGLRPVWQLRVSPSTRPALPSHRSPLREE